MPVDILDVLAAEPKLGWLVARVSSHDPARRKLRLIIGRVDGSGAPIRSDSAVVESASYLSSYVPAIGDIVHALIKNDQGVLVLGRTTGSATGGLPGGTTAVTPPVGDNDTSIATTAFVNAEIANDAPTKTGGGASGTWPINITGDAHSADGFHFTWRDDGAQRTYILNANTPDDVHLFPSASLSVNYANSAGSAGSAPCPVRIGTVVVTTNIAGSVAFGVGAFSSAPVICNGDFNAHARATSLLSWDGPSGSISCGNMNASQVVRINYAVQ